MNLEPAPEVYFRTYSFANTGTLSANQIVNVDIPAGRYNVYLHASQQLNPATNIFAALKTSIYPIAYAPSSTGALGPSAPSYPCLNSTPNVVIQNFYLGQCFCPGQLDLELINPGTGFRTIFITNQWVVVVLRFERVKT